MLYSLRILANVVRPRMRTNTQPGALICSQLPHSFPPLPRSHGCPKQQQQQLEQQQNGDESRPPRWHVSSWEAPIYALEESI